MAHSRLSGMMMAGVLGAALVLIALSAGLMATGARAAQEEGDSRARFDAAKDALDGGMKKLRRSLRSADRQAESLETVLEMQRAAMSVKTVVPPGARLEKTPESERDAYLTGYQKEMALLMLELLKLEIALIDGDTDAAQAAYEALQERKDISHKNYTEEG